MPKILIVSPGVLALLVPALLLALVGPTHAEKADRNQPIVVEADKPGTLDLQRQVVVFNGNVQIVQGTMIIRAERIEVREQTGGYRSAVATGVAGQPASYRQKRDGLNETVEGSADRIEYDAKAGTLRFVGNGAVRRLRNGVVADEITGAEIRWDDSAELFSVQGSGPAGGGRVRAVLTPQPEAASGPAR
ncbi:MAG: lipopolysaccharide transport periplasmic protein LptA [Rubrivivax sp.]|nr:lipopolysaccharide transport periplasmic protein LptA [Rubrivivax sp.]